MHTRTSLGGLRGLCQVKSRGANLTGGPAIQIGIGKQNSRHGYHGIASQAQQSPEAPAQLAISDHGKAMEVRQALFASNSRPIILYDGVCNLCNGAVNFTLDWDTAGAFRYAALQSGVGRALLQSVGRNADDISSIVLIEKDRWSIKSEAVLRIGQGMGMPLNVVSSLLLFLAPRFVADVVYDQVANNRYNLFGQSTSCRLSDERFDRRFVSDSVLAEYS